MPSNHRWTAAQDARLCRLRTEGATWDAIAAALGMTSAVARERGRRIGARLPPADFVPPPDDPWREPLPAGDVRSWGAITLGTVLEGTPYPLPIFPR